MLSTDEEIKAWKTLLENGEITEETYYKEIRRIDNRILFENQVPYTKDNDKIVKLIGLILLGVFLILVWSSFRVNKPEEKVESLNDISEPIQTDTNGSALKIIDGKEVKINYVASYELSGRVVDVQNYYGSSLQNELSPLDVGISWGFLAEDNDKVTWTSNGTRFLKWRTQDMTWYNEHGGEKGIGKYWSNNHLIPSDKTVEKLIKSIRKDDYVKIEGYLVNVRYDGPNGEWYKWNSSTTRNDTGDGACEVIYVTNVTWLEE